MQQTTNDPSTAQRFGFTPRPINHSHFEKAEINHQLFDSWIENAALWEVLRKEMPYGKYQGLNIGQIPLSYLDQTICKGGNGGFFERRIAWMFEALIVLTFLPRRGYFKRFTSFNDLLAEWAQDPNDTHEHESIYP